MSINTYEFGECIRHGRPIMDEALIEYAEKNEKLYIISPDMMRAGFPKFMAAHPERHINVGIAETCAVDVASGMAAEGFLPVVYGMSAFLSMRSYEAVRTFVGYQNHNVKFIGCNTGVSMGVLGSTHYAMEDLSLIKSIPGMTLISPGDPDQTAKAFYAACDIEGPVYIRMANGKNESAVYKEEYDYKIGKGITITEGKDCAIIATGVMVSYALAAVKELEKKGIHVTLIDMHTIKPIDVELIGKTAAEIGKIITVEDHFIHGGLGSSVTDTIMELGIPCKVKKLGIPDMFPGFGSFHELRAHMGYDTIDIINSVKTILAL